MRTHTHIYMYINHHFSSGTQGTCRQRNASKFLSSKKSLGKQSFPFWGAGGFGKEAQRMSFLV